MSKNMTRKGLAFGAGFALVATGLAAMPAQAAPGDVTLKPTTGTGFNVFNTDTMDITATVSSFLTNTNAALSYLVSAPDQEHLLINFSTTDGNATIDLTGIKSDGSTVAVGDADGDDVDFTNDAAGGDGVSTTTGADKSGSVVVDFKDLGITSLLISDMDNFISDAKTFSISVLDPDNANSTTGVKTNTDRDALVVAGYDGDDASISVQAWLETSSSQLVDTTYASDSETVNFYDPKDVSVISKVERMADAYGTPDYDFIAEAISTTNFTIDNSTTDAGAGLNGTTLAEDDVILIINQDTHTQDGLYEAGAGGSAANRVSGVGVSDLIGKVVYVNDGNDNGKYILLEDDGNSGLTGTLITASATAADNNSAYTSRNDDAQKFITGSLRFNKVLNLDQVDLTQWEYALQSSESTDKVNTNQIDLRATDKKFNVTNADLQVLTPAGYSSTKRSAFGRLLFKGAVTGNDLTAGATYNFQFMHTGSSSAPKFKSPSFEVVQAPSSSSADKVFVAPVSGESANTDVDTTGFTSGAYPTSARAGESAITYEATITDNTDNKAEKDANVPVLAVLTAGPNWTKGETLSISGSTETISVANGTLMVSALTDKDGEWEFTVTSSDSSSSSAVYEVDVFMLDADTWTNSEDTDSSRGNTATLNVDYATAGASSLTTPTSVIAAKDVSLTFTIEDAFGEAIAEDSKSRQYSVELTAPDTDDVDLDVVATDGTATFSFDNYLTAGESEILTAKVYRGTSTSPKFVSVETTVTLFAVTDVAGINVDEDITGVIVPYVDFITGKSTTAAPGPTGGTTYSGSVVDANGAGIPGAAVTIAADGFQFKSGSKFFKDSVTVATTSAGTFSVEFWTQVAAKDVEITVTSGGVTATTEVDSKVQDSDGGLSAANLLFSYELPEALVGNTTYAVTATVTDIWGNPISGASVKFDGFAAAQFNGKATETRITNSDGEAVAYLRGLKDTFGVSAIGVSLTKVDQDGTNDDVTDLSTSFTDVKTTSWDESLWDATLEEEINFLRSAPAAADAKVNAGSFKGYVAVYAKGYEGQRLSAKIGNDWVVVPALASSFERIVDFTGAGVDIAVRIYIDRVLMDTINLTTK